MAVGLGVGFLVGLGAWLEVLVLRGEGGAEDAAGGGGGRAVRRGAVVLRGGFGVTTVSGGGGGDSTPRETLVGEAFAVAFASPEPSPPRSPEPSEVRTAAGVSAPPEESGQANQMPAPAASRRTRPMTMPPRRSWPRRRQTGSSSSSSSSISSEASQVRHRSSPERPPAESLAYGGRRRGGSSQLSGTVLSSPGRGMGVVAGAGGGDSSLHEHSCGG
ncbi:hypothetical protein DQ384_10000 [Sphaerisporangium album]|uniref:Uncharacterized protein n=1 Tax=Sphaerisporangium album TaxID=509200 RepID=A0A367FN76_9ACTN|nr:hypothetical protein DQ384_10000 [Sphaerisporangium album]